MNFLFRRRFLQNVGFQLQQRPAPNLYPLSTLSLSYFLSFYPFSLLLLRLTMTHDACVWIIQNPPINNKKNRQSSTIPTCPFLQPNLSLRDHLEIFHLHATFNNMVFIASCYCFLFLSLSFGSVSIPACVVSDYCSFKHVTTFVFNLTLNETSGNFSSLSLYCSLSR